MIKAVYVVWLGVYKVGCGRFVKEDTCNLLLFDAVCVTTHTVLKVCMCDFLFCLLGFCFCFELLLIFVIA
jgi:hypothetical protein